MKDDGGDWFDIVRLVSSNRRSDRLHRTFNFYLLSSVRSDEGQRRSDRPTVVTQSNAERYPIHNKLLLLLLLPCRAVPCRVFLSRKKGLLLGLVTSCCCCWSRSPSSSSSSPSWELSQFSLSSASSPQAAAAACISAYTLYRPYPARLHVVIVIIIIIISLETREKEESREKMEKESKKKESSSLLVV